MIEGRAEDPLRRFGLAAFIGIYAALMCVAPTPTSRLAIALPAVAAVAFWWVLGGAERWVLAFIGTALLLPPLPVAIGDSGPHVALLFAGLGLLAGAVGMSSWELRFGMADMAAIAFAGVLLVSVPVAMLYSGVEVAAGTLVRVCLFGIAVYVYFYSAHGPGRQSGADPLRSARWLFFCGVVSAAFACVDFYYQLPAPAGYSAQFVWLDSGVYRRAQGLFYEASTLGNFCAFFLVMIAVALVTEKRPVSRPVLLAGGGVFTAALVFSYSRASLINVAAALLALVWINRSRLRLRRGLAVLAISLAGGTGFAYAAFPSFFRNYAERIWGTILYAIPYTEGILSGRLENWRALRDFLFSEPWHSLFGVGYKTLPYTEVAGRPVIADNMYLSLLVETGIVGLAAMLAWNISMIATARRAARSGNPCARFFGTWFFCFWCGQMLQMFSGDLLTYWRVLPLYLWVLAVAVRESRAAPTP
jgi:hypothetical protein